LGLAQSDKPKFESLIILHPRKEFP
jgi:hypothetical protein